MRVVNIVLNNFTNDTRVLKTTKTLLGMGINADVVCLFDDGLEEHESYDGVDVYRIRLKTRKWSKLRVIQAIKYIEFFFRVLKERRKADVYHCNDLSALPIGVVAKLLNRQSKVVYDAHEYEINDVPNQSRFSIKIKYFLERFLIKFADEVITVSDSIAECYRGLYKIKKPHVVLNCPTKQSRESCDFFREKFGISKKQRIFLYQGGLARGRGIEILLQAFEKARNNDSVLVCMGYGVLENLIRERASLSPNIYFHPAVSPDVLLGYTSSADYGISLIEDLCLSYRYCLPNKLFEYLMAGLPVIVSDLFEMRRLIEMHQVGMIATQNTVESFRSAIHEILSIDYDELTKNVKITNEIYNWEQQELTLKAVYSGILEKPSMQ